MNKAHTTRGAILSGLLLSTILAPVASHAQERDVITVTAQKREENLQDVPLTVSVIQPDVLLRTNRISFKDYLTQVPGVSLQQSGPGRSVISIRGVSAPNGNPLVGFSIDDVPLGAASYLALGDSVRPDIDPNELERIEILQGPQGTLYGGSTMGGLVKYVTTTPNMNNVSGRIQTDSAVAYHGDLGYGVRGYVDVPLAEDRAGMRVSGFYRRDPGFVDDIGQSLDDVNDDEHFGGRVSFAANLTDSLELRAGALYQRTTSDGAARIDVDADLMPLIGSYARSRSPGTEGFRTTLQFYNLSLAQDLGPVTLTSLTGYGRITHNNLQDFSVQFAGFGLWPGEDVAIGFGEDAFSKKFTQELRLASNGDERLSYTVGLFYTHEDDYLGQSINPLDPASGEIVTALGGILFAIPQTYEEYAAFATLGYRFTDRFDIQVGGRVSHNKQDYRELGSGLFGSSEAGGRSAETPFTFSVSPRFHINDDTMVYARVASGYRPGGPTTSPPPGAPSEFDSDRTVNYEVGLKSSLAEDKVQLNVTGFYIDWKNIQVSVFDPATSFSFFSNGPDARVKGAQADITFNPTPGLTIVGALAYTDAELASDTATSSPFDISIFALEGDRLPYVAKFAGTLSADYHWQAGSGVEPFVGVTLSHTGDRATSFGNSPMALRPILPSFTTVDLRAGVDLDSFTVSLFAKNVGDERGFIGLDTTTAGALYQATLINPRTIGLSVSAKF